MKKNKSRKVKRVVLGEGYFYASNEGHRGRAFSVMIMTSPAYDNSHAKTLVGYPKIQDKKVRLIAEVIE